jgi:serine protease AprX
VIAAAGYILQNKTAYNIRVANFSLHSATQDHFYNDPLDRAVEKLWFNGIFVVAAAGNYGNADGPSGVLHAPGNDPFVMTVGAFDVGTTFFPTDDSRAPWSAYGYTEDGFSKPEISAPGRAMIGPVGPIATLATERPDHLVSPGYMTLSGTSFAAPVVAGAAANILARHPNWTPDQVKGALMLTATPVPGAPMGSVGVGDVNAAAAAWRLGAPNPNANLNGFVVGLVDASKSFDAASWNATVKNNASWNTASWGEASWGEASWNAVSWSEVAFSAASWGEADASWADVSWNEASWADASWGESSADNADGDTSGPAPTMDADAWAAVQAAANSAREAIPAKP